MRLNAPYLVEKTRGSKVIIGVKRSDRTDYVGNVGVSKEGASFFFGAIAHDHRTGFGDSVLSSSTVVKILTREPGSGETLLVWAFARLLKLLVGLTSERSGHRVLLLQLKLAQKPRPTLFALNV